jgi:hypothetical protein
MTMGEGAVPVTPGGWVDGGHGGGRAAAWRSWLRGYMRGGFSTWGLVGLWPHVWTRDQNSSELTLYFQFTTNGWDLSTN